MKCVLPAAVAFLGLALSPAFAETPIPVLAAENFYAEVARAVGGDRVAVEAVPMPANVDPHDFEPGASVARAVSDASLVIFNGTGYDHWMEHLLESTERPERKVIEAAGLIGVVEGDNPHVWYDPRTMPAVAGALADVLSEIDPASAAGYEARRAAFIATLGRLDEKVAAIRGRFAGTIITATEPVFGHMEDALGLAGSNEAFQTAIMNETEPSARDVAAIEDDLRSHRAKVLVYNTEVTDAMTEQLLAVARAANVPVVGVTETAPDGMTYSDWMLGQLDSLEKALAGPSS